MLDFPTPPTRIVLSNGSQYVEVDGRDPDDVQPLVSPHSGVPLPSANELKARQQRREAEQVALREVRGEARSKERREQQDLREAERQRAEEEAHHGRWREVAGVIP